MIGTVEFRGAGEEEAVLVRVPRTTSPEPRPWVSAARDEVITQAMVVPTMLGRILDVLEQALSLLPHVEFVNAYGLTETGSTIAVLGAVEHRAAVASDDPKVRRRLGSVGRPLPTLDVEIRDEVGEPVVLANGRVATRAELKDWVRSRLRSSKTPLHIDFRDELPRNDMGKLLRQVLKGKLASAHAPPPVET